MFKKIPLDKVNSTKNILLFYSRASIHRSFTFNLQSFFSAKSVDCSTLKVTIPFKIEKIEISLTVLLPDL